MRTAPNTVRQARDLRAGAFSWRPPVVAAARRTIAQVVRRSCDVFATVDIIRADRAVRLRATAADGRGAGAFRSLLNMSANGFQRLANPHDRHQPSRPQITRASVTCLRMIDRRDHGRPGALPRRAPVARASLSAEFAASSRRCGGRAHRSADAACGHRCGRRPSPNAHGPPGRRSTAELVEDNVPEAQIADSHSRPLLR